MSNIAFQYAISFTLAHEVPRGSKDGGLHIDPHDPGGTTKWGMAQRYHPGIDVANLSRHAAVELFHQGYWLRYQCGEFPPALGCCLFDSTVNPGASEAIPMMQEALGVKPDGIIGPHTLAAGQKADKTTRDTFLTLRALRYASDSQFARYGKGWLNRVIALSSYAMRLDS